MELLLSCGIVIWMCSMMIGVVMCEWRLNKIQRLLERSETREFVHRSKVKS